MDRAKQLLAKCIVMDSIEQSFKNKCAPTVRILLALKSRLQSLCARRRYKKKILLLYWDEVVTRCDKLIKRDQLTKIKHIKGERII